MPPNLESGANAVTDGSGVFRIINIPEGQYLPLLKKDGFVATRSATIGSEVRIAGDIRMDLGMMRLTTLRGRVIDPEEKPAAGITVQAKMVDSLPGITAVTDQDGAFVIGGLVPGTYKLSAQVKLTADTEDGERSVTTYFPSSLDREAAEPIKVQGVDLSGYNIQLRTSLVRKIRGVVIDVNGEPTPQATVLLLKPGSGEDVEQVLTDDDGRFELSPVLEGDWKVQAENFPDYDSELHRYLYRSGTRLVRITRQPLENVEVRLTQPFALELGIDLGDSHQGDAAVAPPKLSIGLSPLDRQPTFASNVNLWETQRIEGVFPGRYRIELLSALPPGWYTAAAMLDGRDVLGQVAEIMGPGTLRMVYRTDGGSLQGSIENGDAAMVVAMGASGLPFQAFCDQDGRFTIGGLPPGEYTVGAFQLPLAPAFDLMAGTGLKSALAEHGQRVKVEPGAVAAVKLRLN